MFTTNFRLNISHLMFFRSCPHFDQFPHYHFYARNERIPGGLPVQFKVNPVLSFMPFEGGK